MPEERQLAVPLTIQELSYSARDLNVGRRGSSQGTSLTNQRLRGFSLTELSIVISIIAVIMGSAISVVVSQNTTVRLDQTNTKIDRINDALAGYLAVNKRLPCPADPELATTDGSFGNEDRSVGSPAASTCNMPAAHKITISSRTLYIGMVPTNTLGLPNSYATDGWDRRFMYMVDSASINEHIEFTTCDTDQCFAKMTGGMITVKKAGGVTRLTNAVTAILSFGPNGHGAYGKNGGTTRFNAYKGGGSVGADELENSFLDANADPSVTRPFNDATYGPVIVQEEQQTTGNMFDDIVSYKTKLQLVRGSGAEYFDEECAVIDTLSSAAICDANTSCAAFYSAVASRCTF